MEAITNWLEFSAAASQDITDEQYQGMFGSGGARRSTDMASCNPDMSFHHLQPAFNGAVVGANSKSVKSTKQTNILDNDKGKETSSSSHFEHQPGKAIFSAFKYNIMEAMYNKKHTGNEEVLNNMFSAPDMEISQDLAGYLENNSVIGSATAIQPITTAPEHCLALREPPSISSDQDPSTYDDGRVPENGKKPNLDQAIVAVQQAPSKKSLAGSGNRTSMFRGVTKHRWTGRYEGHLWDNTEKRDGQSRRGRQVYLGGYDNEVKAAKAYDLASLKYWGPSAPTNFPVTNYSKDLEEMKQKTNQEYVTILRRRSSGFSRGASSYRGVTRHHQHGRWQARIGRVAGNRDLYLGTYGSQEEAAEVYDIATIKYRGKSAVTNFDINRYDVEKIISNPLPIGGFAKRLRILEEESDRERSLHGPKSEEESTLSSQAESTIYGNAAAAFTASNERPQMGFKQDENPWMKSLQERAQWLQHANDSHILKFLMQQRHANYEKSLQQSMLTPNGSNLQCNPMGFNSPAAINGETGIYNNMSGNFSVNGFPLDNSFPPATSNYAALAHFNNITSNGSVTSMALAHENLFQHPSCLSGPGYEILTGNNGMTAQVLQPQAPAPGMNNRTL